MRLLDKLLGRTPAAQADAASLSQLLRRTDSPVTVEAAPRRPFVNQRALQRAGLRAGMWVITPADDVGIITGCRLDGLGEVTLQRNDGTTLMEIDAAGTALAAAVRVVDLVELRQADIEDIPEPRQGDLMALLAMGYKQRGAA